jgi:hypothetical protein
MRRSVLFFFAFIITTIGCASDPGTTLDSEDQLPAKPAVITGVRPPPAVGIDRMDDDENARVSLEASVARSEASVARSDSLDRAEIANAVSCPSHLCRELRRAPATPHP